jgi:hypothetical protein
MYQTFNVVLNNDKFLTLSQKVIILRMDLERIELFEESIYFKGIWFKMRANGGKLKEF